MGFKKRRGELKPFTELNLTNLVDVTLQLLIAFILVAPTLKQGIELQLPEIEAKSLKTEDKSYIVMIQAQRPEEEEERIYFDGQRVTLTDLTSKVESLQGFGQKISVILNVDRKVPSEKLLKVINTLQQSGVENLGIETLPMGSSTPQKKS